MSGMVCKLHVAPALSVCIRVDCRQACHRPPPFLCCPHVTCVWLSLFTRQTPCDLANSLLLALHVMLAFMLQNFKMQMCIGHAVYVVLGLTKEVCLQELAVDLLYYYPSLHEATARTCAVVCLTDTYTVQLALRVIDVLSARERQEEELTLISFLVTVLLGQVSQAQLSVDRARHAVMVQAVCRAISRVASLGGFLE